MPHIVQVNPGRRGVLLPDGYVYNGPATVTLTDAQYAQLRPSAFADVLTYVGPAEDEGGGEGGEGSPGAPGLSAYQVAVNNGFVGDQAAWLLSLKGAKGDQGDPGENGIGVPGDDGAPGPSAFQVAVANGFVGDEAAWLASLQGADGAPGASAYQIAVANGFVGTEAQYAASLEAGQVLASAERLTNDTTTNITATDVALMANLIAGLSITLVGRGRMVDIEVQTRVRHSVAHTAMSTVLMCNGQSGSDKSYWAGQSSAQTNTGRQVHFVKTCLLEEGVSYTFEVAKQLGAAGTGTWEGAIYWPMSIRAIQR